MKKCNKCKLTKPKTEFYKNKNHPDGLNYECKTCKEAYSSVWNKNNLDKNNEYRLRYNTKYPERHKINMRRGSHKQRYKLYSQETVNDLTFAEWNETLRMCNYRCVYCGAPYEHQDHFLPVFLGGGFTVNNVIPACASCNGSKGSKHPFDFIRTLYPQSKDAPVKGG